jgi:hypothetical protein
MPARTAGGQFARLTGKGAFTANIAALAERVRGTWTAHIVVDQVYAHYQHSHPEFRHPRGGQAFYVRDPLYRYHRTYYGIIAAHAITGEGTDLKTGFREVAEDLSKQVWLHAPWEFNDLRRSGHPFVTRDGAKVYDRAPVVARLSERELREKGRLRYLFGDHRRYAR